MTNAFLSRVEMEISCVWAENNLDLFQKVESDWYYKYDNGTNVLEEDTSRAGFITYRVYIR